jgi:hypothetical protein
MIAGTMTRDGVPMIRLTVAGNTWTAIIDSGFNGDLELPESLRRFVSPRFKGQCHSLLAGGQSIVEDTYRVEFPFAGRTVIAEATFVVGNEILIGTHLLRHYRVVLDFPASSVQLDRAV